MYICKKDYMMQNDKVIDELKRLSSRMSEGRLMRVYLYGSRARMDSREDSDWDILVVTDDGLADGRSFERYAFPFAELGWRLGEQITPLLYTQSEWEAESNTPFYENVTKDAIAL